jgi:hypothetical protein
LSSSRVDFLAAVVENQQCPPLPLDCGDRLQQTTMQLELEEQTEPLGGERWNIIKNMHFLNFYIYFYIFWTKLIKLELNILKSINYSFLWYFNLDLFQKRWF